MPRLPVLTRPATRDDIPALTVLWQELRKVGGRAERALSSSVGADAAARLEQLIDDPAARVVVAIVNDQPVGMAVLSVGLLSPMSTERMVQLHHPVVTDSQRQRGVGHALVAAALAFADELGVEQVAVAAYPSLRDVNRFYARLGFAPVAVRRVAPTAVLRRTLAASDKTSTRLDVVRRRARGRRPVPGQRVAVGAAEGEPVREG